MAKNICIFREYEILIERTRRVRKSTVVEEFAKCRLAKFNGCNLDTFVPLWDKKLEQALPLLQCLSACVCIYRGRVLQADSLVDFACLPSRGVLELGLLLNFIGRCGKLLPCGMQYWEAVPAATPTYSRQSIPASWWTTDTHLPSSAAGQRFSALISLPSSIYSWPISTGIT